MRIRMNAIQAIVAGAVGGSLTWIGLAYVIVAVVS